jgi:serine/threonine protein kinase
LAPLLRRSSDYERIRELKEWGRETWFLVREGSSGKELALEVLYNARDVRNRLSMVRMATLPLIVNLPWLLPTLGFFCDSDAFGLVTEYSPNGTLADALRGLRKGQPPAGFGPTQLMKCVFGVAFAMAAFHSRRGILRTLSPESVFLDSQFEPKIGRLWDAKMVTDPMKMSRVWGWVCPYHLAKYMARTPRRKPGLRPIDSCFFLRGSALGSFWPLCDAPTISEDFILCCRVV